MALSLLCGEGMRHLLFILTMSVASAACLAEEPAPMNPGGEEYGPDAGAEDITPEDDPVPEGVPLSVDPIPQTTFWDTVPVTGTGPANGSVLIESASGPVSVELSSDGFFCLDVPLTKGVTNELSIRAIDERGERSDAITTEILQDGEPPAPGEPLPPENIALQAEVLDTTLGVFGDTDFGDLTDGFLSTFAAMDNAVFSSDWISLEFNQPDGVEKIRIYSSGQECHAGEYLLFTAPSGQQNMPDIPEVAESQNGWTFRGYHGGDLDTPNSEDCSNGFHQCEEYNFDSAVVGVVGLRFLDAPCGGIGPDYRFIYEVEAWSPQGPAPAEITAPSCQGGI